MERTKWPLGMLAAAMLAVVPGAMAGSMGDVRWSGFLSAGGAVSDTETLYNESVDKEGSFNLTRFGLNAAADVDATWSLAAQIVNHGFGEEISFDWGYATYHHGDAVDIKLGKIKYPNGLLSEVVDVGAAYPWVRPPQEFYSLSPLGSIMLLESYRGAALVFKSQLSNADLEFEPFYGNTDLDDEPDSQLRKILGLRASVGNDVFKVQAAYSQANMAMASGVTRDMLDGQDQSVWTVGGSLNWNNVIGYAEYGSYSVSDFAEFDTTAGYVTVGYQFGLITPLLTFASFDQDSGLGQDSVTLGMRYQLSPSVAVKGEWQSIQPKERDSAIAGETPAGLFEEMPDEDRVNVVNLVVDFVF